MTDASTAPYYFLIYKDNVTLVANVTNGVYTIPSVTYLDSGEYECQPINVIGYGVNATLFLNVTGMCL